MLLSSENAQFYRQITSDIAHINIISIINSKNVATVITISPSYKDSQQNAILAQQSIRRQDEYFELFHSKVPWPQ